MISTIYPVDKTKATKDDPDIPENEDTLRMFVI